jgi:hypothetical protein
VSTQPPFDDPNGPEPSEEEMRAAYEAQLKQIRVEDLVVETVVSLLNLGGRRAGLVPGTEDERDPQQVAIAIEAVRSLLPLVEPLLGENADQLRQALSQLQLAFVQLTGQEPGGEEGSGGPSGEGSGGAGGAGGQTPPAAPGEGPGPAQSSGRLWVPGQ